jgi:nuclear pore complex protein Nup107
MEAISLTRTTALCGYAFDFTAAGAEVQDREHINDMMNASLRNSGHHTIRPSEIPTWEEHSHYVKHMRQQSHKYFDLCQIVRVIPLLRQWREEEEKLMQSVPIYYLKKLSCRQ